MSATFAAATASGPTATGDDRLTRGTEPGHAPGFPFLEVQAVLRLCGGKLGEIKKRPERR